MSGKQNGKAKQQMALVLSEAQLDRLTNGERIPVRLGDIELTISVEYCATACSVGEA
jgi:hypothetical protein